MTVEGRDGVVLLHGLGANAGMMSVLAWRLRRAGYRTQNLHYPSIRAPLDIVADGLSNKVDRFAAALDGCVHFVTHSLGGLAARALLTRYRPARLGSVVMLAPPNQGSEWADALLLNGGAPFLLGANHVHLLTQRGAASGLFGPIDYTLGIVAGDRALDRMIAPLLIKGPHDGKVSVESTKLEGMADHIVLPVSHAMMPFHRTVARQVLCFLDGGSFERTAPLKRS